MRVVLVGPFWFPRGSAASARMRNLALGLRDCGASVHVLSMAPPPRLSGEATDRGLADFEGVTYENVAPTSAAVLGWRDLERTVPHLRRRLLDQVRWFAGLYASTPFACRRLAELIRRGQCDLVFVYDRSALRLLPLSQVCRSHGVPAVLDVTEVSDHLKSRRSPLYWDFTVGTRASPRLFDGHTLITTGLARLYGARGCERMLVVPALETWAPEQASPPLTGRADFRLVYVGSLQPRDAPEVLFEAMRRLGEASPAVTLDVIGQYDGTERERASAPRAPRTQGSTGGCASWAPSVTTASAPISPVRTASSSPGGTRARRSSPSPPASSSICGDGRPVFVSDVGDVSLYLKDGQDAVLLHPKDPALVASAIAAVASRPRPRSGHRSERPRGGGPGLRPTRPRGPPSRFRGRAARRRRGCMSALRVAFVFASNGIGGAERSMLRLMARPIPASFDCLMIVLARENARLRKATADVGVPYCALRPLGLPRAL